MSDFAGKRRHNHFVRLRMRTSIEMSPAFFLRFFNLSKIASKLGRLNILSEPSNHLFIFLRILPWLNLPVN
jgi:hypothetical protein